MTRTTALPLLVLVCIAGCVRRDGRNMLYRTDAEALRPLHEWTETFARFWRHQLRRIKERAEAKTVSNSDPTQKEKS